jgi:hypothetical protein
MGGHTARTGRKNGLSGGAILIRKRSFWAGPLRTGPILLLLLVSLSSAQLPDPNVSPDDKLKIMTTDLRDKFTNSKIWQTSLLWYKSARDVAKAVNKEYDLWLKAVRTVNKELSFIEYMARKIEQIKNTDFKGKSFWETIETLDYLFDEIESIYTEDLMYFDYLTGEEKAVVLDFMKNTKGLAGRLAFAQAIEGTRKIWGSLPDYYRNPKLKDLPNTKLIYAAELTTSKGYLTAGATLTAVAENTAKHDSNNVELDKIPGSPVKYLQFQNSFLLDMLVEKCLYLESYKQKITADCQILCTKASIEDQSAFGTKNEITAISSLK